MLFALFPGGLIPADFKQTEGLFKESFHCKNSFIREFFKFSNLSGDFIQGNISVLSINLKEFETLSLKDIMTLKTLLKKYSFHIILSSGKFQSISTFDSLLEVISSFERKNIRNNLKKSTQIEVFNSISDSRINFQKTLRSSF